MRFIHDISRRMTNLINLVCKESGLIAYRHPIARESRECVIRTLPFLFLEVLGIIAFHD